MIRQEHNENKKICLVCGKEYMACPTCESMRESGTFAWRGSCDSMECFKVFIVLTDYFYKDITKAEAKEKLDMLLTEDMKPYEPGAEKLIREIYEFDNTTVESTKEIEEPILEPIVKVEEPVVETQDTAKLFMAFGNKKKKK